MDAVALLKRTDTKFLLSLDKAQSFVNLVANDYYVLEIDGKRSMAYETHYFDCDNYKFYFDHHNERKPRVKVRVRGYLDSDTYFLEIKRKNNRQQTVKTRNLTKQMDDFTLAINNFTAKKIRKNNGLYKTLENSFYRTTLVGKSTIERITIDTNIEFNGRLFEKKLAIIELKQERLNRSSKAFKALKSLNLYQSKFSKYCIGIHTIQPMLKWNNFKPVIRKIQHSIT